MNINYLLFCALVGIAAGAVPAFLHGPIPYKFDVLTINGSLAVWGFYLARCSIGLLVGMTTWPAAWYLRGPLCGLIAIAPLGIVLLATPGCRET